MQQPNTLKNLFILTKSTKGDMRLLFDTPKAQSGEVWLKVSPYNFAGAAQYFKAKVNNKKSYCLDFKVSNPKLWWPNGVGDHCLYKAEVVLENGNNASANEVVFGIRTIEMKPLPGGPKPDMYNWTFVVNGKPLFVKGANWCTMDVMMDLSHARYKRFLTAAHEQHIQLLRAWGGGLSETDDFYNLCDSLGLMVMQEWPTAWNSHETQPFDILQETVEYNTLRIRSHPSLVMWCGGNESSKPFGKAIDMMGRKSIELDDTRPFHRSEPWGGSDHNYDCFWGRMPLNHNLNMTARFWGEFGLPSLPSLSVVKEYLDGEKYSWPPSAESNFTHHTPAFGKVGEIERLGQYASFFMPIDNLEGVVTGSQLAQAEGGRHTLERARTRWPDCSGAIYYKMNDVYPAYSWSSVDYGGNKKIYHYFAKKAFKPITGVILFDRDNMNSQAVSLPVYFLDDMQEKQGCSLTAHCTVYDTDMDTVYDNTQSFAGGEQVIKLKPIELSSRQTDRKMLWFCIDILENGKSIARNWYFSNYTTYSGVMMQCEKAILEVAQHGTDVVIRNVSKVPAVGVHIEYADESKVDLSDNYLWINPGETMTIKTNTSQKPMVKAWNI